jgi:hypothetical protein
MTMHDEGPAPAPRWYWRVSFWRAVAGMAVAIALGCAALAMEALSELSSRNAGFHRRLEMLAARLSRLRAEATDAERQLVAIRAEQFARADVDRVLSAPDVTVLRLTPIAGSNAHGLVAVSKQAGDAIIAVGGLSAMAGHTGVMWWLLARAPAAKAAEFDPDADGRRWRAIQMPPHGAKIAGAIVTLEPRKSLGKPSGRILLKGMLTKPHVLS